MWNGKNKAVTFSYDNGGETDKRLVEMFNRYGLKCTFNLNGNIMTPHKKYTPDGLLIRCIPPDNFPEIYNGHEIALRCPERFNYDVGKRKIRKRLVRDKERLERIFKSEIKGMTYPYGDYSKKIMKAGKKCGIEFARTVNSTHSFKLPEKEFIINPTCHHQYDGIWQLVDDFIDYEGEEPVIFCIWGHSYEFSINDNWHRIERLCKKLSGYGNIFYGTNSEVYLNHNK